MSIRRRRGQHTRAWRARRARRQRAGAFGTTFFVDCKQELAIIMMIQVPLPATAVYRRAVRYLAYQALTPAN